MDIHVMVNWQLSKRASSHKCHKEEKNKTKQKNDFEYFTHTTSIAIVHNLLKSGNKPRIHRISIPE